jgi:hypothetical protein
MALSFNYPVSNITPFTYRDGETYLEQLARLRQYIVELVPKLNQTIADEHAAWVAGDAAVKAQLEAELKAFTDTWTAIIESLQVNATTAFDPTSGALYQGISKVISNVYDNTRVYAYFADQLDNFEYTASVWDAMEYEARRFDLGLAYSPTQLNDIDTNTPVVPNP